MLSENDLITFTEDRESILFYYHFPPLLCNPYLYGIGEILTHNDQKYESDMSLGNYFLHRENVLKKSSLIDPLIIDYEKKEKIKRARVSGRNLFCSVCNCSYENDEYLSDIVLKNDRCYICCGYSSIFDTNTYRLLFNKRTIGYFSDIRSSQLCDSCLIDMNNKKDVLIVNYMGSPCGTDKDIENYNIDFPEYESDTTINPS